MKKYCPACGQQAPENGNYCGICGSRLAEPLQYQQSGITGEPVSLAFKKKPAGKAVILIASAALGLAAVIALLILKPWHQPVRIDGDDFTALALRQHAITAEIEELRELAVEKNYNPMELIDDLQELRETYYGYVGKLPDFAGQMTLEEGAEMNARLDEVFEDIQRIKDEIAASDYVDSTPPEIPPVWGE